MEAEPSPLREKRILAVRQLMLIVGARQEACLPSRLKKLFFRLRLCSAQSRLALPLCRLVSVLLQCLVLNTIFVRVQDSFPRL